MTSSKKFTPLKQAIASYANFHQVLLFSRFKSETIFHLQIRLDLSFFNLPSLSAQLATLFHVKTLPQNVRFYFPVITSVFCLK